MSYSPATSTRTLESVRLFCRKLGAVAARAEIAYRASNLFVRVIPDNVIVKVAMKRTASGAWRTFRDDIAVSRRLIAHGCHVATPSRALPAGPHQHDNLVLSLWEPVKPGRPAAIREAARALRVCHEALADFQPEEPPTDLLDELHLRLDQTPPCHFHHGEARLLQSALEAMHDMLPPADTSFQQVHGDAHQGNTIGGRTCRWLDWEETTVCHPAWDLATLVAGPLAATDDRAYIADAVAGYGSAVDRSIVERYITLRMLQHEVWSASVNSASHQRRIARQRWIRQDLPARRH